MGMIKSFQNINRNKIPKHLQNLRWLHQHSQTASLPCFRILEDIIAERGVFNLISGQKKKKRQFFFPPLVIAAVAWKHISQYFVFYFSSSAFLKVNALFKPVERSFRDALPVFLCWPCCDLCRLSACLSPPTASRRHKHKSVWGFGKDLQFWR